MSTNEQYWNPTQQDIDELNVLRRHYELPEVNRRQCETVSGWHMACKEIDDMAEARPTVGPHIGETR